jgi:uncharacterized protein
VVCAFVTFVLSVNNLFLELIDILLLFIAGCFAGTLSGLLGVGGGVINVAILTYYFDREFPNINTIDLTRFVLSNSFLAIFFSSIFGSVQQMRMKNFYLKEVLLTASTTVIVSFALSLFILEFDWYSRERFTWFFVVILTGLMIRMLLNIKNEKKDHFTDQIPLKHFPVTGIFTGIFSALSGLGGGVVTVPVLSDVHKLRIKKATSISLGVMPLMALCNVLAYSFQNSTSLVDFTIGYIKPDITIPLVAGVIICAPLGVKLSGIISGKAIRIVFVSVVSLVIFRMLYSII